MNLCMNIYIWNTNNPLLYNILIHIKDKAVEFLHSHNARDLSLKLWGVFFNGAKVILKPMNKHPPASWNLDPSCQIRKNSHPLECSPVRDEIYPIWNSLKFCSAAWPRAPRRMCYIWGWLMGEDAHPQAADLLGSSLLIFLLFFFFFF